MLFTSLRLSQHYIFALSNGASLTSMGGSGDMVTQNAPGVLSILIHSGNPIMVYTDTPWGG